MDVLLPNLGIYHVHQEDGEADPLDVKLTRDELHDFVDGLLKAGKAEQANQFAVMCAWARLFGHKVVVFYDTAAFRIFNPVPPEQPELEESAEMRTFFAEWEKAHPGGEKVPTVVSYRNTKSRV